MSIPEEGKRTSNHQVVKVTYDTEKMHKFMIFNLVLSVLLMITVIYMNSLVCGQNEKITTLAKIVNQLNYKIDQQSVRKPKQTGIQNLNFSHDNQLIEQLQDHFEFSQQDIKKIKFQLNGIEQQIQEQRTELKNAGSMIKQQSKSSWQMKEIIEGIKSKLEFLSKMIEKLDIQNLFQKIPKPDFKQMKDKIKGTFDNIKDKVGGMFDSEKDQEDENPEKKKDEGMFDGIKDRFRRGWRTYTQPAERQRQL